MGRIKNLDEIKAMIRQRTGKRNIFRHAKREDVESVLSNLTSKDPDLWAQEWSRVAEPYEEKGAKLEQAGQFQEAGFSVVMCGPGSIDQAHQPDEYISLDQVRAGTEFIERLVRYLSE